MTSVDLRPETQDKINRHVMGGAFSSADDVVMAGLGLLEEQEATASEIHAKIAEGVAQVRRGEVRDGDAVFRDLLAGIPVSRRAAG